MAKNIYIFSGLGADEKVFHKLDFTNYNATYIKWIVPNNFDTIESYASQLLVQITKTNPILIGLSFGGIMAIEVAKLIETDRIILIASVKTKNELPFYYRIAGKLGINKLLPIFFIKKSNFITNWFFGVSSDFEKQLLKQILIDTHPIFLKWAIHKIVNWKQKTVLTNIFHIHGTKDRILPNYFVNCNIAILNGGHFMTLNKSQELNVILNKVIESELLE